MRDLMKQTAKRFDVKARITAFIEKLKSNPTSKQIGSYIETERSYFKRHNYASRSIKSYFTAYKNAIATQLPPNEKAISELKKTLYTPYPEFDDVFKNCVTALDYHETLKRFLKSEKNLDSSIYEKLYKLKICHSAFYRLRLNLADAHVIKSKDKKAIIDKKTKRIEISRHAINNFINKISEKDGLYKTLIFLMLCSGRRPIELLKTGSFKPCSNYSLMFSGQVKLKNSETKPAYEIPILHISAKKFLEVFNNFRSNHCANYAKKTNVEVNNAISTYISEYARKNLLNSSVSLYTCRAIYACFVAEQHPNLDRDIVMRDALGHSIGDISTAQSYQSVVITSKPLEDVKKRYDEENKNKKEERKALTAQKESENEGASSPRYKRLLKRGKDAQRLGKACERIHLYACKQVFKDKTVVFNQTKISKELGSSRPAIKKWLSVFGDV